MELDKMKEYRFNRAALENVLSDVFSNRAEFVKQVHKNPKKSYKLDLYEVNTFSEAYDTAAETLHVFVLGLLAQSSKRFTKYSMQYKVRMSVTKTASGYLVTAHYR